MKSILRTALVLLVAQAQQALAGTQSVTVSVGGESILIPAPPGFHEISQLSPETRKDFEKAVPPENRLLAAFVSEDDLGRIMKGELLNARRYLMVEAHRELEHMTMTGSDFADMVAAVRRKKGAVSEETKTRVQRLTDQRTREVFGSDASAVQITAGEEVPLGVFVDKSDVIGYATISKSQVVVNGVKQDLVTTMGVCFVKVRSKYLYVVVTSRYDEPKDLEWLRATSSQWPDQIVAANVGAGSGTGTRTYYSPSSGGRGPSVAAGTGIVVIGYVVYRTIRLFRKARG